MQPAFVVATPTQGWSSRVQQIIQAVTREVAATLKNEGF